MGYIFPITIKALTCCYGSKVFDKNNEKYIFLLFFRMYPCITLSIDNVSGHLIMKRHASQSEQSHLSFTKYACNVVVHIQYLQ